MVYGYKLVFQEVLGALKRVTRCSGSPLPSQFVLGDPQRLSSPHTDTGAWHTSVPRKWCMIADMLYIVRGAHDLLANVLVLSISSKVRDTSFRSSIADLSFRSPSPRTGTDS